MKLKKTILVTVAISMVMSSTAFAGTWRTGAEPNQNRWWYDFDNDSYAANGWQWIDGDNNGVAECYYFDSEGWMLANATTPDGYQVNADGAWVENGVVQTNIVETQQASEQPQAQEQTETAASLAKYAALSGSYNVVDVAGGYWPHDQSWINQPVTVVVTETNGTLVVTFNGIPLEIYAMSDEDTAVYGYISSLGSIGSVFGDGRMFISSDDGSEVFYQK